MPAGSVGGPEGACVHRWSSQRALVPWPLGVERPKDDGGEVSRHPGRKSSKQKLN